MLRDRFIDGMSRAAATVAVVTTDGAAGRAGVTVSAMASVSADSTSPSLLVCVHRLSPAAPAILANGVFCVNLLRDSQAWLSDTFAGRRPTGTGDKFEAGKWTTLQTGAPVLADGLVAFDCTLRMATLYGSHYILVGEVEEAVVAEHGPALVYANRAYGSPVALGGTPASRREGTASGDELVDTAVFGSTAATKCGFEFYPKDKILFASDCPFDPERGPGYIRDTIAILESLSLPKDVMEKICHRNAEKLMKVKPQA